MIEHVHGCGEEHALVGLTGAGADDPRQKRFADAGIADDDDIGAFLQKLQIHQTQDAALDVCSAFVMAELETINRGTDSETRETETAFDGTGVADFQFAVRKPLQRSGETEVFGSGISQNLIQILTHRREAELIEFLM